MVAGVERVKTKPRGPDSGTIGVWHATFVGLTAETQSSTSMPAPSEPSLGITRRRTTAQAHRDHEAVYFDLRRYVAQQAAQAPAQAESENSWDSDRELGPDAPSPESSSEGMPALEGTFETSILH